MLPVQTRVVAASTNFEPDLSTMKASNLPVVDTDDDAETTDVGQSSASETESSSGLSGNEGGRNLNRRCRFARTLETIPATPSATPAGASSKSVCRFGTSSFETVPKTPTGGVTSQGSPAGFSHTAMRQARDACQSDAVVVTSNNLCRFGATAFDTVPKTPVGASKYNALKGVFRSPPGLSRASMRQERDACGAEALTSTAWGASKVSSGATTLAFQPAPHSALLRIKQDAARLKDLKVQRESSVGDQDLEGSLDSSSEEESSIEAPANSDQQCRFGSTALGTVPSTPVGGLSPPGLSRAAMRQARDARKAGTAAAGNWQSAMGAVLTISSSGKPMTPPSVRASKDAPNETSRLQAPR